jgi:hypothetical protein
VGSEVCDRNQPERGGGDCPRQSESGGAKLVRYLLSLGELSELCFQQCARTIGGRNLRFEISPVHANKLADGAFDILLARPAGPTSRKMRLDSASVTRRKLAIDGQEQFLIGEMRFFRQHKCHP